MEGKETADRTERILALLLLQGMKGATQAQKAVALNIAGFTAAEIADLLETSTAVIHTHLYEARKKRRKKK